LPAADAAEEAEGAFVLGCGLVGWIEEDEVQWRGEFGEALEERAGASVFEGVAVDDLEGSEIGAERRDGGRGVFGEPDMGGSAADGFYTNGSGAGVEVYKSALRNAWRENVEEGFAQAVACGTGRCTAGREKLAGAEGSGDDTHRTIVAGNEAASRSAYNGGMRGWSFPIGRFLGVDVRIHTFFVLLLGLAISYGASMGSTGGRGFGLWMLLLLAVVVREVARAIAAAWYGLELRSLLLLPFGGLMSYASTEATERATTPAMQKRMAVIGPLANMGFGLLLAGLVLTVSPQIDLFERPWITPTHLLRSAVWMNLLLGAINLLPASPLDGGRVFRGEFAKSHGGIKGMRAAAGLGQAIAFGLIVAGALLPNMWMLIMGGFVWLGARMEDQGLLLQTDVDAVRMRDVMLIEFSTLSASDTLEDALQRSIHTLQDVFPVVRGGNLVGAVSRQGIVEALQADGNGYVQGVMTKSFQTAGPDDSLVKTLKRIMAGTGAQLVPVLEGDRIVGIITPQNLAHSMGMLNQRRRMQDRTNAD
jgi:Zn-dependent protease/CBS domain-containing protein